MSSLCVILGRAGSKGLPGKNAMPIAGRPMIAWTIDHARAAKRIDRIVVSTDGEAIAQTARGCGVQVIDRPVELANDTAPVDAAVRHAVTEIEDRESPVRQVVILYANVPVRPADLIDRAIAKLEATGCDSVQSVCPVGKMHPYWQKKLAGEGGDVIEPFIENAVYRRQDLPPVHQLDGGVIVVRREALFTKRPGDPHGFLGGDRRAVLTQPGDVVDVDDATDAAVAEARLGIAAGRRSSAEVVVGGRPIGGDAPAYVIAELGVNHDGSVDRALDLARAAKDAGADAVKLQWFDPDRLLSAEAELAKYQQADADDPHAMLQALRLGVDDMLRVKGLAHALGLGFILTPFSMEELDAMRRLDVDAVKIASPDCVNTPLLEAMHQLGKPMIISTGASEMSELIAMLPVYRRLPCVLLQCVSAYPVAPGAAALGAMAELASLGVGPVGYSDHTTGLLTGMLAAAVGASVIERHLTYDPAATGPDHAASLSPADFARYVEHLRAAEAERGKRKAVQPIERDVRRVSRQSVCVVRDLKAGAVIRREDVTVKRPGTGLPASRLGEVVGKRLNRDVKANHLVHDGDVDLG